MQLSSVIDLPLNIRLESVITSPTYLKTASRQNSMENYARFLTITACCDHSAEGSVVHTLQLVAPHMEWPGLHAWPAAFWQKAKVVCALTMNLGSRGSTHTSLLGWNGLSVQVS